MKIKDFIQNTPIQLPLLISNVSQGVTQNGAPYLSFLFQDSSGQIEGKWWDVPKEALESAEIGKIGSNLNQIARKLNQGGVRSVILQDQIHECIDKLFDLRREVMKLAGDHYGDIETQDK